MLHKLKLVLCTVAQLLVLFAAPCNQVIRKLILDLPALCSQRLVPVLDPIDLLVVRLALVLVQLDLFLPSLGSLKPAQVLVLQALCSLMLVLVLDATLFPVLSNTRQKRSLQRQWTSTWRRSRRRRLKRRRRRRC